MPDPQWYVPFSRGVPASLRMICYPHAGGGPPVFQPWADLVERLEIIAAQPPGRWARLGEKPFNRMAPLVRAAVDGLPQLDTPFVFYGHSLGALVAFEAARELRRRSLSLPEQIFVSGRPAPHIPIDRPPVSHLPENEFVDAVQSLYQGIPQAVLDEPELLELIVPPLRADMELLEHYQCSDEAPLPCPISAFGGTQDGLTTTETLEAWSQHTTAACVTRELDGGHFFPFIPGSPLMAPLKEELGRLLP